MAKIMSTLVGQGKGKIGAEVLYRANGEQYIRARAISVANPQSNSQMYQRLAIVSAAKLSAQLQGIIDHSFESLPYGTKSIRHFNSLAARAFKNAIMHPQGRLNQYAPVLPKGATDATAVDGLQISQGSLSAPVLSAVTEIENDTPNAYFVIRDIIEGTTTLDTLTLGQFLASIGCNVTDQLTFIFGVPVLEDVAYDANRSYGAIITDTIRINFKEGADLTLPLLVSEKLNTNIIDEEKSTNVSELEFAAVEGNLHIEYGPAGGVVALCAVIRSAYVSGAWRRSTSVLNCASRHFSSQHGSTVGEQCGMNPLPAVIATYRKSSTKVEDRYLNQEDNI